VILDKESAVDMRPGIITVPESWRSSPRHQQAPWPYPIHEQCSCHGRAAANGQYHRPAPVTFEFRSNRAFTSPCHKLASPLATA